MTLNVLPATRELTDLAVAVRPDFDRTQVEGAISAARSAGWSFPRVLLELARLLVQEDSAPRDLIEAARAPLARASALPPDVNAARAAEARASLTDRAAS